MEFFKSVISILYRICIYLKFLLLLSIFAFFYYNICMYLREFKQPPVSIIENGKAHFGTYNDVSPKIDIRGMRAPYAGIPVPSFLSNLRIKSRLNYVFLLDKYIGIVSFFDFKAFGLSEVILWNKDTNKKNAYHATMPTRRRFVPINSDRGLCTCYKRSRRIKISWGKNNKRYTVDFKLKGDSVRPTIVGELSSQTPDNIHKNTMFVSPSPASSRCSATWISPMNIKGKITINQQHQDNSKGLAMMMLNRTYYKTHSHSEMAYGLGYIQDKKILFNIKTSNLDAADSDNYNENILYVDGKPTALPPVYITHPFGINNKWIIQDTESMIDLSFEPLSTDNRTLNIIALRTQYSTLYGNFEGVLLTESGEKITLKNFSGIIYTSLLRI